MNRRELEQHIADSIDRGELYVWLEMNGSPDAARQRLLGHHKGPYGWVCGWNGNNNVVRFNAQHVQEYLDELPIDDVAGDDDVLCRISHKKGAS